VPIADLSALGGSPAVQMKKLKSIIGPYTYLTLAQLQLFQTPAPDTIQKVTVDHNYWYGCLV
jgi:hypothetical protein